MQKIADIVKYDNKVLVIYPKSEFDRVELLAFFRNCGLEFVEECYDSGPLHHSYQKDNCVLEIYPPRKK